MVFVKYINYKMIITISGTAGSGKSTVAKLLAKKLKLKHYSMGDLMRKLAKQENLSLKEYSEKAEKDYFLDAKLDEKQKKLGRTENNFVIDGRLSFYFIPHSLKVFLDADLKCRAERILNDIQTKKRRKEEKVNSLKEITSLLKEREKSERKRYQKYYQVNPYQKKKYDLVIDTSHITAEQAVDKIVKFIQKAVTARKNL